MASLMQEANKHWILQFATPDKRRRTIRLGKRPKRDAETVKHHTEAIIAAAFAGNPPPDETARWLRRLADSLYERLAAAGLTPPRARMTLAAFIDDYVDGRHDTKASTHLTWSNVRRNLVDYFGELKPLRDITPGDADEWRRMLIKAGLADSTVGRRCGIAKQLFRFAKRKRLIDENPFEHLKAGTQANADREHFITEQDAVKVLDACPDSQWRLLFALSRWGGLRCPSEHLSLRWGDIDWEHDRMTVTSPKTEHHPGGESRIVPLFPELRTHLAEVFEEAEPGTEYVITRYSDRNANLRTQLQRILKRAGIKPWPKLFQNLRASRETELAERFPIQVVCSWIGNSPKVAMRHYLQTTEAHFEAATSALQNPTYGMSANGCKPQNEPITAHNKTPEKPGFAEDCSSLHTPKVGRAGLEPATKGL
jgi:integrase